MSSPDTRQAREVMRVAAARKLLAEQLPHVVYQGRPSPDRSSVVRAAPVRRDTPLAREQVPPARAVARTPEKPPLDKPLARQPDVKDEPRCKARPEHNRPKGGGGGRPVRFVPWCDRK